MTNLEKLELSANRSFQNRIYENIHLIDQKNAEFYREKKRIKEAYAEEMLPYRTKIIEHRAHIATLKKERKEIALKERENHKNRLFLLRDNYKLAKKEIETIHDLHFKKMEAKYRKIVKNYDEEIKKGNPSVFQEKEKFVKEFEHYLKEEERSKEAELKDKLNFIKAQFTENTEQEKSAFSKFILDLDEMYYGTSKKSKILEEYKNDSKTCKAELKKLNRVYSETLFRKKEIENLQFQINDLKRRCKKEEAINKNSLLVQKNVLKLDRKNYFDNIKKIKAEKKSYYSALSEDKKKEFKHLETFVKQENRMYLMQKLDRAEKRTFRKVNTAYIYILPMVFGALFFTILPFLFMIVASFFKLDLAILSNSKFMGFKNFVDIFTRDIEFQKALGNTVIYSFTTIVLLSVITISMAAWLSKNTKIHNITQTMVFTPHIASLVAISILWIAMLNPGGIINQVLKIFGIEGPAWLMQENTSLISVSFVTVWKDIGYYVLIIISGLQAIPSYVYEAAKLDKASKANAFFRLTIPLLTPTLSFVFVTKFINSFKVFAPIEIMTNGGPMGSSMVLSYWIYKVGRVGYNYGQAMAGAIILTIMIAICTYVNFKFFNKKITY